MHAKYTKESPQRRRQSYHRFTSLLHPPHVGSPLVLGDLAHPPWPDLEIPTWARPHPLLNPVLGLTLRLQAKLVLSPAQTDIGAVTHYLIRGDLGAQLNLGGSDLTTSPRSLASLQHVCRHDAYVFQAGPAHQECPCLCPYSNVYIPSLLSNCSQKVIEFSLRVLLCFIMQVFLMIVFTSYFSDPVRGNSIWIFDLFLCFLSTGVG